VSAAIMQLAIALERGEVTNVTVKTSNPDRLHRDLVEAGARCEQAVMHKEIANRGGRLEWRQGSVVLESGVPVLIASEMRPVQRDPLIDVGPDIEAEPDRAIGGG
jgi:hypothetical protein